MACLWHTWIKNIFLTSFLYFSNFFLLRMVVESSTAWLPARRSTFGLTNCLPRCATYIAFLWLKSCVKLFCRILIGSECADFACFIYKLNLSFFWYFSTYYMVKMSTNQSTCTDGSVSDPLTFMRMLGFRKCPYGSGSYRGLCSPNLPTFVSRCFESGSVRIRIIGCHPELQ